MSDFAVSDIRSWHEFTAFVSRLPGEWAYRGYPGTVYIFSVSDFCGRPGLRGLKKQYTVPGYPGSMRRASSCS